MYNYKTLSKSQLIELINTVESTLASATVTASNEATKYSPNPDSRYPFEVGFLNGMIKEILSTIQSYKNC
jgi:hypothetical protein